MNTGDKVIFYKHENLILKLTVVVWKHPNMNITEIYPDPPGLKIE